MRILLVNHGTAGDWGGGDGVQMRETGKRLMQRGHSVELINADRFNPAGFDLVHIFNCRVHQSFEQQLLSCHQAQMPVVVSPIWVSIARALWGSRGSVGLLEKAAEEGAGAAQPLLDQLRERRLTVMLPNGHIQASGDGSWDQSGLRLVAHLLKGVDGLLPNSWLELQAVRSDLHWDGDCFEVAHYGVDPKLFLDADPSPFRERFGLTQPFVLQAGRIEPAKNQAMLCWALRETNLPIVLIGNGDHWPSYRELCQRIYGERLLVIDHLPQEQLASAYAAAAVHVLPSWMETCGLVSLEAALAGTPLVGSTFGHELEYLGKDAWYGDPADPTSIKRAVLEAIKAGPQSRQALSMKRKVLEKFNWEKTVDASERLYRRVLQKRSASENA
ncbi:glycosyltransferase family 4 protein [Cyanobium sp. WAJ14-Wanaka]|uniref:glycosyltransferase family 4 protein n=1 Tax=Cyanobium sp. WAJ14-Wanaka TaxID=2823725 RepID=UPI0020CDCD0B|nr:glycosyltransferase family 4 protein [Cyanobium sp. WAJ14-Wanaka]MCP9775651.1 glycosyltransferase family 4 protein [Cyanobium sp. WAJ14-Wanaka]